MDMLGDLMCKVLPDVNALAVLKAANDAVSPCNACGVVFVHRGGLLLSKTHPVKVVAEAQHLRSSCRSRIVFYLCC